MSKKILVAILALSLIQAPSAHAGFFDFFKTQIAAIGLVFANLFRSNTPPRITSDDTLSSVGETSGTNPLAVDPNDYQVSTEVVEQPSQADCTPVNLGHSCSHLESDQVVSNSCLNPVAVKTGSNKTSGRGATGN